MSDSSKCRSCQAPITWGKTAKGKPCPLDPNGKSHFLTCPNATEHSKKQPEDPQGLEARVSALENRVTTMALWLKQRVANAN